MADQVVIFVHGWSVTDTDTYGGLPDRLRAEAARQGITVRVEELFLGRYISFHDEVRLPDISRAFQAALEDTPLADALVGDRRFVCITHSTGGPVVRDWWQRYYSKPGWAVCPMSHLIMLAPANYGSALAQLGKGRLGRLKSWFGGIEPGQGVLDWLELGSAEAWQLNMDWITGDPGRIGPARIFPFVLIGQSIDRAFYDNLNTYTGEMGSDGVVRSAAANLQGCYIRLEQQTPVLDSGKWTAEKIEVTRYQTAPQTPFRIIGGKSHSGDEMGIMRSVKAEEGDESDQAGAETMACIMACLTVNDNSAYTALCSKFQTETAAVQEAEQLETEKHRFLSPTYFIHDRCAMLIFRVSDDQRYPVNDFDLTLTAGPKNDANHLPAGFYIDRQRNRVSPNTITYYVDADVMLGSKSIKAGRKIIRPQSRGAKQLGFSLVARPDQQGFVHYLPCEITADKDLLKKVIQPNTTTLIDIVVRRIVHKNVFRAAMPTSPESGDFKKTQPGTDIIQGQ